MSEAQSSACGAPKIGQIVWFELPTENVERSQTFYRELFGWTFNRMPGAMEYYHIGAGGSPDGGMMKRQNPAHVGITNYVAVESVDATSEKAIQLGGKICLPKMAVSGMGYFAVCQDADGNTIGIWQHDPNAK